jgi:putative ABC transport system permease protein
MSLWTRIRNALRGGNHLNGEIDEELESHLDEAIAEGRDPVEVRQAFGSPLRVRETTRDVKLIAWLDSLRADAVFGWRQLMKNKVTSVAAILSLALASGASTSAFRLIDALLLRPLPVAHPEQLYSVTRFGSGLVDGKAASFDGWAHPTFLQLRTAVKDEAELMAITYIERTDLTYGSDQDMEKAQLQYVSGSMFTSFGLQPTLGRLLTEADDRKAGEHPYAVLSYDYWTRRFGRDQTVLGRTFHVEDTVFDIVGVGPERFTGTETGTVTDMFLPAIMHAQITSRDTTWHRILARLKPGVPVELVRTKLNATSLAIERERAKGFAGWSKESLDQYLEQRVILEPASAGLSGMQQEYRRSLMALAVLVGLVLLIACANVANLMMVQTAARACEMALRVSIGAGRWRLIQLLLLESAWVSCLAAAIGGMFAWWAAPFVVRMINPPDNPARLYLPWDWRVFGFALGLTLVVTVLFGLTPALRASSIQPSSALKGGEDPFSRRRLMHVLIAAQVAFCFVVLFVAGLFAASFEKLSNRPTGFSAERLLTLETVAHSAQSPVVWSQVTGRLNGVPGVERTSLMSWPLLNQYAWMTFVSLHGEPPGKTMAYMLSVSPGWADTMKIRLLDGRDLLPGDAFGEVAIVNETFAKQFFGGENPVGKSFVRTSSKGHAPIRIVGLVSDAVYKDLREPILPVAYMPFFTTTDRNTFVVRTAFGAKLSTIAALLRKEVSNARADFRVSNIRTQEEINRAQTVRERLLAMLALFFGVVAMLLAGIGLYGVLDYSVLQRRREFGIRIAIGAPAANIVRLVSVEVFGAVIFGAAAGLALGAASVGYVESLFYGVKSTDAAMLSVPAFTILAVALIAALRPVIHALRIDPVKMLRTE